MQRILGIFKLLGRGLMGLAMLSILVINLTMAYIMFAPDDLPKPFYLAYSSAPGAVAEAAPPPAPVAPAGHAEASHAPAPESLEPGQGIMFNTGTKVVNLVDPTGRRYLKVTVVLEFAPPDPEVLALPAEEREAELAAFQEELNARLPVINDILTTLLSSKTFEDVYTLEGKEQLREEIAAEINARLPEFKVLHVYFTEFVIQ